MGHWTTRWRSGVVATRRRASVESAGREKTKTQEQRLGILEKERKHILEDTPMKARAPRKKPDHRLRAFVDEHTREVIIEGNRAGLEYLAAVCQSVIGQAAGANHWHLGEAFETLDPQSLDLLICYRAEFESFENDTAAERPSTKSAPSIAKGEHEAVRALKASSRK